MLATMAKQLNVHVTCTELKYNNNNNILASMVDIFSDDTL